MPGAADRATVPGAAIGSTGKASPRTATVMLANGDIVELGFTADTVQLNHTGARSTARLVLSWPEWRAIARAVPQLPPLVRT